jgi:hypothetical protein
MQKGTPGARDTDAIRDATIVSAGLLPAHLVANSSSAKKTFHSSTIRKVTAAKHEYGSTNYHATWTYLGGILFKKIYLTGLRKKLAGCRR